MRFHSASKIKARILYFKKRTLKIQKKQTKKQNKTKQTKKTTGKQCKYFCPCYKKFMSK